MGFRQLNITLKVRLISNFFQEIVSTAFLPFIALYLTDMVNPVFSGIFLSSLVILSLPITLLGGYLIEVFPQKKMILTYQLIMSISLLFIAFSLMNGTPHILLFCIGYSIFSIIWGLQYPATDTLIMNAITPEVENYVYKFDYWLTNVAIASGAFLGGMLYTSNKSLLLLSAAMIFFLIFLSLWKWIKPDNQLSTNTKRNHSFKAIFQSYGSVLSDKRYLILTLSFSLTMMAELSTSSYVSVRLKETFDSVRLFAFHIDGIKMFSLLTIVSTLVVVTCTPIIIKYLSSLGDKWLLISGLFLYVIGYSNVIYLNHFTLLILFMIVATVGEILYSPIFDEKKYKLTPEKKRGTYSSINNIGYNLSELLARLSIALGALLTPLSMALFVFIILSIGSILMYASIYSQRSHNQHAKTQ